MASINMRRENSDEYLHSTEGPIAFCSSDFDRHGIMRSGNLVPETTWGSLRPVQGFNTMHSSLPSPSALSHNSLASSFGSSYNTPQVTAFNKSDSFPGIEARDQSNFAKPTQALPSFRQHMLSQALLAAQGQGPQQMDDASAMGFYDFPLGYLPAQSYGLGFEADGFYLTRRSSSWSLPSMHRHLLSANNQAMLEDEHSVARMADIHPPDPSENDDWSSPSSFVSSEDVQCELEDYEISTQATSTSSPEPERESTPNTEVDAEDLLLQLRSGPSPMTYREITRKYPNIFPQAESTLRGRYRSLIKPKGERVRNPTWTRRDIALLLEGYNMFGKPGTKAPKPPKTRRTKAGSHSHSKQVLKGKWEAVAEYIVNAGGSYKFGAGTCSKKYRELVDAGMIAPECTQEAAEPCYE